ncbi:hypothetical protein BDW59DRAFT_162542 [Aspergillus cavernicola]|uniref:Uncharacterized protein n=1 Tax=Aspergillus cavernicola TaxID=176166 RepID=A0ABR4I970_9EURO
MAVPENSDFQGRNQVFNSNMTLLNQIHQMIWKVDHGRRGIKWSCDVSAKITGTQKEAGRFSAGFPNDYLWYTVTLHDGTYNNVKFDEWHVQFPVYFEKYQLSDDEVAARLVGIGLELSQVRTHCNSIAVSFDNMAADVTALTYCGNVMTMVSNDVNGLSSGFESALDAVKAAAAKVPPWSAPWATSSMTVEHSIIYGTGIMDAICLAICMGARAATGVPHDYMAYFASVGSVSCSTLALAMRIIILIIGVDELSYEQTAAIYSLVSGGLGWVSDGAGLVSAGFAVAEQPEISAGFTLLSLAVLGYSLLAMGGEVAYTYKK